ncbi:MAG: hypothetical protein BJ554DRAFT_2920, partial [Olpidium bornovanus]
RVRYLRTKRQPNQAVEVVTQITIHYPTFIPAYVERFWSMMEAGSWEIANEAAHRLLSQQADNLDALIVLACVELCRDGRVKDVVGAGSSTVNALIQASFEMYSTELVLGICDRADEVDEALRAYEQALQLDPQNAEALEGLIRFGDRYGMRRAARRNVVFHLACDSGLSESTGKSTEVAYLSSVFVWAKYANAKRRLGYLNEAAALQMNIMKSTPVSLDYFVAVSPNLLLEIVRALVECCPATAKPRGWGRLRSFPNENFATVEGQESEGVIQTILDLLTAFTKVFTGNVEAMYHVAQVKLMAGGRAEAQAAASLCLKIDPTRGELEYLQPKRPPLNGFLTCPHAGPPPGCTNARRQRPVRPGAPVPRACVVAQFRNPELPTIQPHQGPRTEGAGQTGGRDEGVPAAKLPRRESLPTANERLAVYLELADAYSKAGQIVCCPCGYSRPVRTASTLDLE